MLPRFDYIHIDSYLRPASVNTQGMVAAGSAIWIKHAEVPDPRWIFLAVYDYGGKGPTVLAVSRVDPERRTKVQINQEASLSMIRAVLFASHDVLREWRQTPWPKRGNGEGDPVPLGDGNGRAPIPVPPDEP